MDCFHLFFPFIVFLGDLPAQDCGNLPTDWRNPECDAALGTDKNSNAGAQSVYGTLVY